MIKRKEEKLNFFGANNLKHKYIILAQRILTLKWRNNLLPQKIKNKIIIIVILNKNYVINWGEQILIYFSFKFLNFKFLFNREGEEKSIY